MSLLDRYDGAFEADFALARLSRSALARLGRETMRFAHLHDQGLMPRVGARFGAAGMTTVACDEWMGASPVYNRRLRGQLAIPGNDVPAILKALQVDVGFPHQYMDVGYELVDESQGFFWLRSCGAYEMVHRLSRGSEAAILQLCHHMEDTTFDATVMAVNPRARCRAVHRPPLAPGHSGPACRWEVSLGEPGEPPAELPLTRRVAESGAGQFEFAKIETAGEGGLDDYAGAFVPELCLEDFSQPRLVQLCKEFALDVHLLMRAAFASLAEHFGDEAHGLPGEHWRAVAPVLLPRVREALGITGEDAAAVLKTLQVDPAFPADYVQRGFELTDEGCGRFWIEDCAAFEPGEAAAWLALLEDPEDTTLEAVVGAVSPGASVRRVDRLAWEIRTGRG